MICFNLLMIHYHKRGFYNAGGGYHELSVDLSKVVNSASEVLILRQPQFPATQKITVHRTIQEELVTDQSENSFIMVVYDKMFWR